MRLIGFPQEACVAAVQAAAQPYLQEQGPQFARELCGFAAARTSVAAQDRALFGRPAPSMAGVPRGVHADVQRTQTLLRPGGLLNLRLQSFVQCYSASALHWLTGQCCAESDEAAAQPVREEDAAAAQPCAASAYSERLIDNLEDEQLSQGWSSGS